MKHRKRLFFCLLTVLLLFSTPVLGATIPEPDAELLYVTDLAGVLSRETEEHIAVQNDALYAATGAQFAILTVDSLPAGYDSESYCYEVFNAWGVGSAEKNNGLLLLLVPDEGKFWMTSGTGLQGSFSGGTVSELLEEHLAPDFDAGRYDEAVLALFDAVWSELEELYGVIDTENTPAVPGYTPEYTPEYDVHAAPMDDGGHNGGAVFLLLVIVLFVLCIAARPGRRYYTNHTPPPPGNPPYYRTYMPRPRRTVWHIPSPMHRPPTYRPPHHSRPTGGSFSSRPSGGRSFGGGHTGGRSSGGSRGFSGNRSFGGGRSHGGGGGRR